MTRFTVIPSCWEEVVRMSGTPRLTEVPSVGNMPILSAFLPPSFCFRPYPPRAVGALQKN